MTDIVVLGSLNMDLSVNVRRMPLPGETISGGDLITNAGGKGANQAAACAKLGSTVSMVGCVGQDDFGRSIVDGLKQLGVDTAFIKKNAAVPTGTAMILVDDKGENTIVLSAGANATLVLDAETAKLISGAKLLILQLEINPQVVFATLKFAHQSGVKVLLNPAPAIELHADIYPFIDYLVPNESEASLLAGVKVADAVSAEQAAEVLLAKGAKNVIITLGAKGSVWASIGLKKAIPPCLIEPVDTTGAGDAFIGGFSTAIIEGKSIAEALALASACGALAATKRGAQSSLPTRQEVKAFLASNNNS